jgi:hypothetical protein
MSMYTQEYDSIKQFVILFPAFIEIRNPNVCSYRRIIGGTFVFE